MRLLLLAMKSLICMYIPRRIHTVKRLSIRIRRCRRSTEPTRRFYAEIQSRDWGKRLPSRIYPLCDPALKIMSRDRAPHAWEGLLSPSQPGPSGHTTSKSNRRQRATTSTAYFYITYVHSAASIWLWGERTPGGAAAAGCNTWCGYRGRRLIFILSIDFYII